MAKLPKLGTGTRTKKLVRRFGPDVKDKGALAASIGRKKFGTARFQNIAARGQRRALRRAKR